MEEGDVAEQGQGPGGVAAAEGDADGGGDGAVDAGQATVPDDEPVLVRGVRRGHQVEVPDRVGRAGDEGGVGADRGGDLARDVEGVEVGAGRRRARRAGPKVAVGGAPRLEPGDVIGRRRRRRRRSGRSPRWRATRPGSVTTPPGPGAASTSMSAREMSRVTGRDSVGWPRTTTRSISAARRPAEEQPVGADRVGADPCAGRRFGQQRPAGPLGEDPCARAGVVAGDDDGARPAPEHLAPPRRRPPGSRRLSSLRRSGRLGAVARGHQGSASGSSGSSSWRLRWVGPRRRVATSAAASSSSDVASTPRSKQGAKTPKIPSWRVVWLAPLPRIAAGRSAARTTRRRPEWDASITAGSRFPTAVPDVVTTATGVRDPPRARARGTPPTARRPGRAAARHRRRPPHTGPRPGRRSVSRVRGRPRGPHRRRARRAGGSRAPKTSRRHHAAEYACRPRPGPDLGARSRRVDSVGR